MGTVMLTFVKKKASMLRAKIPISSHLVNGNNWLSNGFELDEPFSMVWQCLHLIAPS
jgi:hypothetical protein